MGLGKESILVAGVQAWHNPQQGRTDAAILLKLPGHTELTKKS